MKPAAHNSSPPFPVLYFNMTYTSLILVYFWHLTHFVPFPAAKSFVHLYHIALIMHFNKSSLLFISFKYKFTFTVTDIRIHVLPIMSSALRVKNCPLRNEIKDEQRHYQGAVSSKVTLK